MAQNVTFYGDWETVPYVTLPKTEGGTAAFTDVTDTTASAADVTNNKYFYTATGVRVKGTNASSTAPTFQSKTVTPSESQTIVTPDANYDGLDQVTVNAITASYVGTGITRKSSTDLTVSGATIVAPAGYYAAAATKTVATATQATPTIAVSNGGLITATVTQSTGYVTGGTKSATHQLSTQAGTTITPTKSSQTAIAANKYAIGTITVGPIPNNYIVPTGTVTISANGVGIDVAQYATANVSVDAPTINLQNKTVAPATSAQTITADNGYDGLGTVTVSAMPSGSVAVTTISVNSSGLITATATKTAGYIAAGTTSGTLQLSTQAGKTVTPSTSTQTAIASGKYTTGTITVAAIPSEYIVPTGTVTITTNSTGIDVSSYASADVAVPATVPNLTTKTVTPSESKQTITAGTGYDGLSSVTVNAITASYVGSEVNRRTSSDMTMSGATVTAPAGYYASAASKTITSMTLPTTTASTSSGTIKATVGRSTSDQYINIPTGYNGTAASYKISAVANGTATPAASLSGSSATLTTGTNTLTLQKTISNTPNVSAGYISSGTAGNTVVTLTATVTTKAAATITPTTTNQTIAAGTYLTGAQTIAGDADLVASNIVNGVQIFGVTGNVVLQNYYTGTSAPSSSLGSNGDIYIQQQEVGKCQGQ